MEDRQNSEHWRGYISAHNFAATLTTTELHEAVERAEDLRDSNEAAHKQLTAAYYAGKADAYRQALSKREGEK